MPNVNRRFFENQMEAKNLSLRGLAAKMGMSHSQLSLVFSGARNLKIEEAAMLADILGVPITKVIEAMGVKLNAGKRVNVIGAVQGDGTIVPADAIERTTAPDSLPDDVIAIQCRTAGTQLHWMDAWVLFCRKPSGVDPEILGRLSYVKVRGGPAAIAHVKRGYQEGTYQLSGPYRAENVVLDSGSPILITRN